MYVDQINTSLTPLVTPLRRASSAPPLDAKTQFLQACAVKTVGRANAACGAGETRNVLLLILRLYRFSMDTRNYRVQYKS